MGVYIAHRNNGCPDVHALMHQHLQQQVQMGGSKHKCGPNNGSLAAPTLHITKSLVGQNHATRLCILY